MNATARQSAYIRYRASAELDALTVAYITRMETEFASGNGKPDNSELIRIMDLFVAESVDVLLIRSIDAVGLHPTAKKLVHGLASVVVSTASMLVSKVAKGLDADQHRRVAAYMKDVRLIVEEDGQVCGEIAFAVPADVAERGWAAARYALNGGAQDPQMVRDGVKYLHEMSDVAMHWVFEEPVRVLGLSGLFATVLGTTVRGVKKSALALVDKVVPRLEPHQIAVAAEYFATLVRTGPYREKFGAVTAPALFETKR